VIESPDGTTTTFKLQTRDLTPTFGSPLGAQLVDVYVHTTDSAPTSTSAAYPQRNYTIAAGSAWSRLIEVQGFGQRFVNAQGTNLGTVTISANSISRYITFSVPTSTLGGTPSSGWGFTVVLTGQDGFSPDQARSFQSTPAPYNFGVCATASTDLHLHGRPEYCAQGHGRSDAVWSKPIHGAGLHAGTGRSPGCHDPMMLRVASSP